MTWMVDVVLCACPGFLRRIVEPFCKRTARPEELQLLVNIDDEASQLYSQAGLQFSFEADHPFVVAESSRWAVAIERGLAHVAVDHKDQPVGFAALAWVDREPYLDQIAVRPIFMRRGVGTMLLRHAISWSAGRPLWLTTYSHLSWNRPYYERHGFTAVPEFLCGPELRAIIEQQRAALPDPFRRVAMIRRPD